VNALWVLGGVVLVTVVLPALGHIIRAIIRRPLTPEQIESDRLAEEWRRNGRYFWR